jgi:putative membrane protein
LSAVPDSSKVAGRRDRLNVALRFLLPAALLLAGSPARTHEAPTGLAPGQSATAWGGDLLILPGLVLAAVLYARGTEALWRRAGAGRGIGVWQAAAFYAGLVVLLAATVSPLDALANTLFSWHMAQHMLLLLVAAPLLVAGEPGLALLWGLAPRKRLLVAKRWQGARWLRSVWAGLSQPLVAWSLFAAVLWMWHLPSLYQLALISRPVHAFEHLSLLAVSYLFWWLVLQPLGRRKLGLGAAIVFVFTASLQVTLLGALISLAPEPLYPLHGAGASLWGLEPLADQRLAALLMRTPMTFAFLLAVAGLFLRWLAVIEKRAGGSPEGV